MCCVAPPSRKVDKHENILMPENQDSSPKNGASGQDRSLKNGDIENGEWNLCSVPWTCLFACPSLPPILLMDPRMIDKTVYIYIAGFVQHDGFTMDKSVNGYNGQY